MKQNIRRAGLAVMAVTLPKFLMADNLAALVYPVVIWPAGVLLCIVFTVLSIVYTVKRSRGKENARPPSLAAGIAVSAVSAVLTFLYVIFILTNENAMNWPDMAMMSIVPVIISALAAVAVGVLCAIDAHRRKRG